MAIRRARRIVLSAGAREGALAAAAQTTPLVAERRLRLLAGPPRWIEWPYASAGATGSDGTTIPERIGFLLEPIEPCLHRLTWAWAMPLCGSEPFIVICPLGLIVESGSEAGRLRAILRRDLDSLRRRAAAMGVELPEPLQAQSADEIRAIGASWGLRWIGAAAEVAAMQRFLSDRIEFWPSAYAAPLYVHLVDDDQAMDVLMASARRDLRGELPRALAVLSTLESARLVARGWGDRKCLVAHPSAPARVS